MTRISTNDRDDADPFAPLETDDRPTSGSAPPARSGRRRGDRRPGAGRAAHRAAEEVPAEDRDRRSIVDRKAQHLATLGGAARRRSPRARSIVYHLAEQRPMMGAFLDALGIAHENGLIQEENVKPDAAKMKAAVAKISAAVPGGGRADLSQHAALSGSGNLGRARGDRQELRGVGAGGSGLAVHTASSQDRS